MSLSIIKVKHRDIDSWFYIQSYDVDIITHKVNGHITSHRHRALKTFNKEETNRLMELMRLSFKRTSGYTLKKEKY